MNPLATKFREDYGSRLGVIAEFLIIGFIMDRWSFAAACRMAEGIISHLARSNENLNGMGI